MIGRTIGSYRIDALLGSGGMGSVYRGLDLMLDRDVAIKALRADVAASPQHVERFRQEARTLARLLHPHIATLYALLRDGNDLYMVMEYVEGETFEAVLHRERRVGLDRALDLFGQALRGIEYAHLNGVVHRDVKPANFMVGPDGTVKVMDFGIARLLGTHRMTQTRHAIGTAEYMAPEQVRGHEVDARTDVYALGVLLYELLTGRVPFDSESFFEVMQAHLQQEAPSLRAALPDVPDAIEGAVGKALSKAPEDRHASVAAFRDALGLARLSGEFSRPSLEHFRPSGLAAPVPDRGPDADDGPETERPAASESPAAPSPPTVVSAVATDTAPAPEAPAPEAPAPEAPAADSPAEPPLASPAASSPDGTVDVGRLSEEDVAVNEETTAPWPPPADRVAPPTRIEKAPSKGRSKARTRAASPPTRVAAPATRIAKAPGRTAAAPTVLAPAAASAAPPASGEPTPAVPSVGGRLASLPRRTLAAVVVGVLLLASVGVWALVGGEGGPAPAGAETGLTAESEAREPATGAEAYAVGPSATPRAPGPAGMVPPSSSDVPVPVTGTDAPAQPQPIGSTPDPREPAPRTSDRRAAERPAAERPTPDRRTPDRPAPEPRNDPAPRPRDPDPAPRPEAAPAAGAARIVVRPFGDVYVGGERLARGTNAPVRAELPPGTHTVRATHPVFGEITETVQIRSGQTSDVLLEFATPADVTVVSDPSVAEIYLDGKSTGRYTPASVSVPPGTHTISVRRDGYRPAERQVTVGVGRSPGRISLTLSPNN